MTSSPSAINANGVSLAPSDPHFLPPTPMTNSPSSSAKIRRTRQDEVLFNNDIGEYEYCPACWVEKGWLIVLFIDDGYPIATLTCPRCKYDSEFNVMEL